MPKSFIFEIWDFLNGTDKNSSLLVCYTVYIGK